MSDAGSLAKGLELLSRRGNPPIACCPACVDPTPLVCTLVFRHAEFYCLDCGGRFGFLEPRAEDKSDELDAALKRAEEEWAENAGHRLTVEGREPVSEKAAEQHAAAMRWLAERVKA